jgi:4'-phosphopantetheinyl transferase EntD
VAVGRAGSYAGIGIDAEPAEPLAPDIARRVCSRDEAASFARISPYDSNLGARVVFSIKEAIYKCVFPITHQFLGFEDVSVSCDDGTFDVRLRVNAEPFPADSHFFGRWRRVGTHVVTAAWISAARLPQ